MYVVIDVTAARRRLLANGDDCSAGYKTVYGYDCQLVTISSRPAAVHNLHGAVEHNPAGLIARCDVFRRDGLPGAKIFSPCPTSTRWVDNANVDDDSVNQVSIIVYILHLLKEGHK